MSTSTDKIKFTYTPEGVAALVLKGIGAPASMTEVQILSRILQSSFNQGLIDGLEKAKEVYKEFHSGGCRMYSKGDACECFLCRVDNLLGAIE